MDIKKIKSDANTDLQKLQNLLYTINELGYTEKIELASGIVLDKIKADDTTVFDHNTYYYFLINSFGIENIGSGEEPIIDRFYYVVTKSSISTVINKLIEIYANFFNSTNYSYNNFNKTYADNFEKFNNLTIIYKKIGIDDIGAYNASGKKIESPTINDIEKFAKLVYYGNINNTNDLETFLEDIENSFRLLNKYRNISGSSLISSLNFLNGANLIEFDKNKNITTDFTDNYVKIKVEGATIDTVIEKLADNIKFENVSFPDGSDGSKSWEEMSSEEKLDWLKDFFSFSDDVKYVDRFVGSNGTYRFFDSGAVSRLQAYVDNQLEDYIKNRTSIKKDFAAEISSLKQEIYSIKDELYNGTTLYSNGEGRVGKLETKVNNLEKVINEASFALSNTKFPKNADYIFTNNSGNAFAGYLADSISLNEYVPVSSNAVYNFSKLFAKSGGNVGFGKTAKIVEKTFDKNNATSELQNFNINGNNIQTSSKIIYIPVIFEGSLTIYFATLPANVRDNVLLIKDSALTSYDNNIYTLSNTITGTLSGNNLTFEEVTDTSIVKVENGKRYIALLNNSGTLTISKIVYTNNYDFSFEVNDEGIVLNKNLIADGCNFTFSSDDDILLDLI